MNNPEINLAKQSNYIIVVSPENEREAFNKSIDIAREYVKKETKPKITILSDHYKNNELDKIRWTQVQTFKKGTIRIIDKHDENSNSVILERISKLLKNGMIIIDDDIPFDDELSNMLLAIKNRGQDYILHRNTIKLLDAEIDYIRLEYEQIKNHKGEGNYKPSKNIILRLHDYPDFPINKDALLSLYDSFGQIHGFAILLAYYISRKKTILFKQELEKICKEENETFTDYINPHEFQRQTKNYVYYNLLSAEIINVEPEFIKECAEELIKILQKAE